MRETKEERLNRLRNYDSEFKTDLVIGLDEAGRGALAGPIYAGAVILDPNNNISDLNDSKKIIEHKRYDLLDEIKEKSFAYGIGIVDSKIIDTKGIQYANFLAFKLAYNECIEKLKINNIDTTSLTILIDGNYKNIEIPNYISVKKGDTKSASIAAASIIAKASRDLFLKDVLNKTYPNYYFNKHKGYGTKEHRNIIKEIGLSEAHRKSFCKNLI